MNISHISIFITLIFLMNHLTWGQIIVIDSLKTPSCGSSSGITNTGIVILRPNDHHEGSYDRAQFFSQDINPFLAFPLAILYSENFNSGRANNWQIIWGTWEVNSGIYNGIGNGGNYSYHSAYTGSIFSDFYYSCNVKYVSGVEDYGFGITFRRKDDNNMYVLSVDTQGIKYWNFFKFVNNIYYPISDWCSTNLLSRDWNKIAVNVKGNRIEAFLNDQSVGVFTDNSFSSGTIGLIVEIDIHAQFDDISVSSDNQPQTDDHGNSSINATPISVNTALNGNIEVSGDVDYFSLSATARTQYQIETSLGNLADSFLYLYDQNGTSLLQSNDDIDGGNRASRINWSCPATGTYFIMVKAYSNSQTGTYTIRVIGIADDYGNEASKATSISKNTDINGNIEVGNDEDWFKFSASANSKYTISTTLDSLRDSYLYLYDRNGTTLIKEDDDSGGNRASKIVWLCLTSGDYYIKVKAYSSTQIGSYSLRVVEDISKPPEQLLINGLPYNGEIAQLREEKWYNFQTSGRGVYIIETYQTLNQYPMDTVIYLYGPDSQSTLIETDDDGGIGSFSKITKTLESERTYYVKVIEYGNNAIGHYTIDVHKQSDPTLLHDYVISFDYTPSSNRLNQLSNGLRRSSNFLWIATYKQIQFRKIDLYSNQSYWDDAHIRIHNTPVRANRDPQRDIGIIKGFFSWLIGWPPRLPVINLGTWTDGGFSVYSGDNPDGTYRFSSANWDQSDTYRTIVHEICHLTFLLQDEYYRYDNNNQSITINGECTDNNYSCIMDNQFGPTAFCIPSNHDADKDTAQEQINHESCYSTLKRNFQALEDVNNLPSPQAIGSGQDLLENQGVGPLLDVVVHFNPR